MPGPNTAALDEAIVGLVSRRAVKVPPYSAVAMRVQELVRREDFGLEHLTKLVQSDQALATDALRVANSAFYSRGTPIATLPQAIGRIGAQEVARLAIASGLGAHVRAPGPLAALKRRVWLESLAAAGLCQELAKQRALPVEEAFVCGLLHDFGKIITIACIEEILDGRRERAEPWPLECWLEVVDRYHVELGLVLAARWELPQLVSDVVSLHHAAPDAVAAAVDPRLVQLVMAADEVVKILEDRTWVAPDDLAHIPLLSVAERDLVARVLDRLPGFIASFEGVASTPPQAGSHLIRADAGGDLGRPPAGKLEAPTWARAFPQPAARGASEDRPLPELLPRELLDGEAGSAAPSLGDRLRSAIAAARQMLTSGSRRSRPHRASRRPRAASASRDR